ncbi:MAG: hypothetical protein WD942_07565 [Dehalococcoidia bacterium]
MGCSPAGPAASQRAISHCEYLLTAVLPTAATYERVDATVYGYQNGDMTLKDDEADIFTVTLRYDAANLFGTPTRQRAKCTFGRREKDRLLTIRSMEIAGKLLEKGTVLTADVSVLAREFEHARR